MPPAQTPNTTEFKGVTYFLCHGPIMYAVRIVRNFRMPSILKLQQESPKGETNCAAKERFFLNGGGQLYTRRLGYHKTMSLTIALDIESHVREKHKLI